ncbi:ACP S-malonyltransferase [Desulfurella sp.]|uniref:ACP S-malonyltransferase n=1 Tax=Desulfurella sp. TaxID=1962857 RepID=UPI0025BB31FD|nr:ACP S-malonyltransferase [Desulfurella sp.]
MHLEPDMKFLIFTGQGSQFVGMIKDLYDNFDIVKKVVKKANESLSFNLSNLMFNGPSSELVLTQNAQPAILTASIAIFELLKSELGFDFDISAGHSLGQYSSLVAAGSLELEDAVFAVYNRGKYMQEAVSVGLGAMMAVIGNNIKEVEDLCKEISKDKDFYCDIANYNAPTQIIVSGYKKGIAKLQSLIKENNLGKTIMLDVSAPFHCKLMEPVVEKMQKVLDSIKINPTNKIIIENVNSNIIKSPQEIKQSLLDQIAKPVRWIDNVNKALSYPIELIVECGPKDVLSVMLKRNVKNVNISGIFDLKSYNTFRESVWVTKAV